MILLFKRFLRNPFRVTYLFPSGRYLVNRTLAHADFSKADFLVELGPGEGVFTREIQKRMGAQSKLLVLEIDAKLAKHVGEQFRSDARIQVMQGDALDLPRILTELGWAQVDYVVSGIPFSFISRTKRKQLLSALSRLIKKSGAFITYQTTTELNGSADDFVIEKNELEIRNFPPMWVSVYRPKS